MTSVLLELVRHKTWATNKLFSLCAALDPAAIDATTPGTYGTIRATLVHLVNADHNYYRRLRGELPGQRMDEQSTELQTLVERFNAIADDWQTMADDSSFAGRELQYPNGEMIAASAVFAQSLHHADVHRAHVLTIIGAQGVEVPELDLWEYARETGVSKVAVV